MDIAIYGGDVHIHTAETKREVSVHTIRTSNSVTNAKKRVKERDGVCQCCGEVDVDGHLEIHHIFPLSHYKDLASDENNMIALCQSCHARYHNRHDLADVNPVTFAKFLKNNCRKGE